MSEILLKAAGLKKHFPIRKGFFQRIHGHVKAVDGIDLEVRRGESVGLVGESGCGKSTLGRTLIRLYEPTEGSIEFQGQDFCALKGPSLRKARRNIQMVFQDPFAALDPRMTVAEILMQPFKVHGLYDKKERIERVKELMKEVGLKPSFINRYPHEFSGGQRQRISIARSMALNPDLVIADEPVSALDVSIQAQILNLLKDLQEKLGLTYIFISHDLSVVEHFCDRVAVMYLGKIVEFASRDEIFSNPKHPYTQTLLSAVPRFGEGKKQMKATFKGEVPSPINPPSGCAFHPRCEFRRPECSQKRPALMATSPAEAGHQTACWMVHPQGREDRFES